MRFVRGPIPSTQAFDPKEKGWTPLDNADPEAKRFATVGNLLALPFVATALWLVLGPRSEVCGFLRSQPLHIAEIVLLLAVLVPVHELIHAAAYFKGLRSPRLIIGVWASRTMIYVIYDAPMPRHRMLLVGAMPFLLLSAFPAVCLPWLELRHELVAVAWFLVVLHTGLCAFDFLVMWRLFSRVPRGAWVHNNGWTTYWTTQYDPAA